MGLTGRHRQKTHSGWPLGLPGVNVSGILEFYYQWRTNMSVSNWSDLSKSRRNVIQESEINQPTYTQESLDFEDTDSSDNSSMMSFGSAIDIATDEDFLMFIVWTPETTDNNTYLSDGDNDLIQLNSNSVHIIKTSGTTNTINHSSTFTINAGEKSIFMIHRTNGSTGTIKLYKNGLVHDPSVTDADSITLTHLGSQAGTGNWYDGKIYDLGIITGSRATNEVRDKITGFLCGKHGVERLGHY